MWEALQSIVIGLLAPGGVWLGWLLQHRDKASERERDTNELLRAKAEEIYQEIEAVRERNYAAVMDAVVYIYKADAELGELAPSLGRLKALVHMYFPGGAPLLAQYDIAVDGPIKALSETINEINADDKKPLADRLKQTKEARLECVQKASNVLIELLTKLTAFMNDEVKKLI